jgi:hypothetical protein
VPDPILIAHRGNVWGPDANMENHPFYVSAAISMGFHAEVDLWVTDDGIWFGHDAPVWDIQDESFLLTYKNELWIHCKTLRSLEFCLDRKHDLNFFWHEGDDYTLTSQGIAWTFPGRIVPTGGVLVDKGLKHIPHGDFKYICSDWVGEVKKNVR